MKPKIKGLIIPEKWDDNGGVFWVALHIDDEKKYVVEHR
jgi:hypothetical protein